MVPAVQRYQDKTGTINTRPAELCVISAKWNKYVLQVVRMNDRELHREYVYCSFLVVLLPVEPVELDNIAELPKLEIREAKCAYGIWDDMH